MFAIGYSLEETCYDILDGDVLVFLCLRVPPKVVPRANRHVFKALPACAVNGHIRSRAPFRHRLPEGGLSLGFERLPACHADDSLLWAPCGYRFYRDVIAPAAFP